MNRRQFLLGLGSGLLLPTAVVAQPAAAPSISLVQIVNFHCGRCRTVDEHQSRIKRAATAAGMDLRVAPVAWDAQSLWPNRAYYAFRDLFPGTEDDVRTALFDGVQTEGQRFEDLAQVLAYLERKKVLERARTVHAGFEVLSVADYAVTDHPLAAEVRAIRLLELSGAEEVPVFVWVREGQLVHTVSPANAAEPGALVQHVLQRLQTPTR